MLPLTSVMIFTNVRFDRLLSRRVARGQPLAHDHEVHSLGRVGWSVMYTPAKRLIKEPLTVYTTDLCIYFTRRMQSICGRAQRAEEARPATYARCAGTHAH